MPTTDPTQNTTAAPNTEATPDTHTNDELYSFGDIKKAIRELSPDMSWLKVNEIALVLYPTQKARIARAPTVAGRIGLQINNISELTVIAPLKEGGAERLKKIFKLLHNCFYEAQKVGTLHDMRFVFLDNDTKMLFATTYDGDFDIYINDFATKIPLEMDLIFSSVEGWPGITSPTVKDFIAQHQIQAVAWYVDDNQGSVPDTARQAKMTAAADQLLDEVGQQQDNQTKLSAALKEFVAQAGTL